MQAIQEVAMAKEWIRDVWNEAKVEANLYTETNRALGATEQKNRKLRANFIAKERARRNTKVGL